MRFFWIFLAGIFVFAVQDVQAALPGQMNLRFGYEMYTLSTRAPELYGEYEKLFYKGKEVILSEEEQKNIPLEYLEKKRVKGINKAYIQNFLETQIAPNLSKKASEVKVSLKDGKVVFSNPIIQGRELNVALSVKLIEKALQEKVDEVELAVSTIDPVLHIDPELKAIGIKELISVGESNFSGSSVDRIHNIQTAVDRFNGHIVKKDEEFSFVNILGPVDGSTGYKKELVIKGDSTIPEFGGGVCQVSSTLYRGVMLSGLPIKERANHSYAVSYYMPWGSDATIYPGSHDLRFSNVTQGAMLIHAFLQDTKLSFVLLGTRPERIDTSIFGPYITNPIPAPPTKYLPSRTLPAGEQFLISPAHNGFTSTWFRVVNGNIEKYVSRYEARPKVYKVGGMQESVETAEGG